uniref:Uncharacterized protein n=1 Tax=Arundo donax TaxID=35708 RepID=A0A0A9GSY0_ARUDO
MAEQIISSQEEKGLQNLLQVCATIKRNWSYSSFTHQLRCSA